MTKDNTALKEQREAVDGDARRMDRKAVYLPATDVYEQNDAIVVIADMPGVPDANVEVELENQTLSIRGRTEDMPQEGFDPLFSEFVPGVYERAFTVSTDIKRDAIKATMKHGVLRVVLPKSEAEVPRKIKIESE